LSDRGAHHIILITRKIDQAPADLRAKFAGPLAPKVHAYAEKLHTEGNRSGKLVLRSMCTYQELPHLQADLLVNCTPVGMAPKTGLSPVPAAVVANCGAVVDVIYNPAETELLRLAKLQNKPAVNGLYMLVAQAVAAEEIWLERRLDAALIDKLVDQVAQLL
jgi:shikimate 5-dehydrogenase